MTDFSDELARINDKGEVHPIGVVASKGLRQRQGTFRVLPSPEHVVFLRLTGEDGQRDEEDGAVVRLAGEITAPASLCDIVAMLGHARWQGELVVLSGATRRSIFMEYGNVAGASTTVRDEWLGAVMYRFGALTAEQHAAIDTTIARGTRFGTAAVESGAVTEEQVYDYLGKQIEEVFYGAMAVSDGTFFFLDGFDHARLTSQHNLAAEALLMLTVTRLDELRYFRQKIPSSDWVPVKTDRAEPPPAELREVYDHIDGDRSVAALGRITGWGESETTKAVYALAQSKHVAMRRPRMAGGPVAVVETANLALRSLHARVASAGKATLFRNSLDNFAGASGVLEILFHGAGPKRDGSFDSVALAANVGRVSGSDTEQYLKERLHEYVSFALFSAGSTLGQGAEDDLSRELAAVLADLRPAG